MALLTKFGRALRQEVNFGKSSLFSSTNTKADMKGDITDHMAIQEADPNSMYLGLPNEMVRNKNEILGFIKGRLPQRIQNWENKTLTHAGKVILLKTVAQALSSYAMYVFLLPLGLMNITDGLHLVTKNILTGKAGRIRALVTKEDGVWELHHFNLAILGN
ncbi:uncharacterized protein LOC141719909 [Apium graveolens]|uniref:uncharacterized protein LOC141719909 n=1 Tax=Apium graveolens TaxID=4045 RepID=UPI003D7A43A5